MARKEEKKETYYQRWLKGKKRMLLIMKEEEFNAVKQFCDQNKMSYREFFTQVAPKLLVENQQLRKALEETESRLRAVVDENEKLKAQVVLLQRDVDEVVEQCKGIKKERDSLEAEGRRLKSEVEALRHDLTNTRAELENTRRGLEELKAQLNMRDGEVRELKGVLDVIVQKGKVDLPPEYCEQLKKYGFHMAERKVGDFIKKTVAVCTNS